MITAFFKIYLDDVSQPFELILKDETTFTFNYGFGREQWGFHDLRFKIKLSTNNSNNVDLMRKFTERVYPYLNGYKNIKEIVFEFIDDKTDSKEGFSLKKGEFSNLNMTQIVEPEHSKTFTIALNVREGESK